MSVNDHGLEAIRKSAGQVTPGSNAEYYLLTKIIDAVTGSFTPSGLTKEIKVTTLQVGDSAVKLPATPLTDRNTLSIFNKSSTVTIYIDDENTVTADSTIGGTGGWEVLPNERLNIDIKNAIELWAIAPTGQTAIVKLLEVA